ncbi:hypothetical protein DPX16_14206 [Anabarilius grahami]|uniref:Uncharacterized protein n=1 Tax=Anabarilius grahami TaxID=495550 RepID=A0A3N0XF53_ANAGA|nr:hypothetical protein DPX16_14206 [Anabarilius grahami]
MADEQMVKAGDSYCPFVIADERVLKRDGAGERWRRWSTHTQTGNTRGDRESQETDERVLKRDGAGERWRRWSTHTQTGNTRGDRESQETGGGDQYSGDTVRWDWCMVEPDVSVTSIGFSYI